MIRSAMDGDWLQRWWDHLANHINPEVRAMHLHRKVWLDLQEVLQRSSGLPDSYWWEYLAETYATTQAVALRRQADRHEHSISLTRTLMEMREHGSAVTLDYFLTRYGNDENRISAARERWRTDFAPDGGDSLNLGVVSADLDSLATSLAGVRRLVNKHLAHRDAGSQPATLGEGAMAVTFEEAHVTIDVVGALWRKYNGLMTGAFFETLAPHLPPAWTDVFRYPWLTSDADEATGQADPVRRVDARRPSG